MSGRRRRLLLPAPLHLHARAREELLERGGIVDERCAPQDAQAIERAALADEKVAALLEGKTVRKVIVVPGKMVNIVAG